MDIQIFRPARRPVAPDAALAWLHGSAATQPGVLPSQIDYSLTQAAAALSAGAARLIAAPHQPRPSRWEAFGAQQQHQQQQQDSNVTAPHDSAGGSAPAPVAAPTWPEATGAAYAHAPIRASQPAPVPSRVMHGGSGGSWAGRSQLGAGTGSSGGAGSWRGAPAAAPGQLGPAGGGSAWAAPAQQDAAGSGGAWPALRAVGAEPRSSGHLNVKQHSLAQAAADFSAGCVVRAGSNSPPPALAAQRHTTVYPPGLQALGSAPASQPLQQGVHQQRPQHTQRTQLQQPSHLQQPPQYQQQQQLQGSRQQHQAQDHELGVQLSGCGQHSMHSGGGVHPASADAAHEADLDSWQSAPTAAELLLFVQHRGLQSLAIDEVMRLWRDRDTAPVQPGVPPAQGPSRGQSFDKSRKGNPGGPGLVEQPQQQRQQQQQHPQQQQEQQQQYPQRQQERQQQQQHPQWQQEQQRQHPAGGQPSLAPPLHHPQQQHQMQDQQHLSCQAAPWQQQQQQRHQEGWVQARQPGYSQGQQQQHQQQQQQPRPPSAPASADAPTLRQAVLVSASKFVAPEPPPAPPSAWARPQPAALRASNSSGPQPPAQRRKSKAGGTPGGAAGAAAAAGVPAPGDGGTSGGQSKRGSSKPAGRGGGTKGAQRAAAGAASVYDDSDASDFEDPGSAPSKAAAAAMHAEAAAGVGKPPKKKARLKAPAKAAAGDPAPSASHRQRQREGGDQQAAAALVEVLELDPLAGVIDACTPLGFARLLSDMEKALSCGLGLLLVDPSGCQFFSNLEALTKQQQQSIKAAAAAAAAAAGGKKPKASGKGKGKAAAAPTNEGGSAAAGGTAGAAGATPGKPAAPAGAARVVGLCVQPIHGDPNVGPVAPVPRLYFLPLADGTWGGLKVGSDAAEQGRDLAGQLLVASPRGGVVAFNMQGLLRLLIQTGVPVPAAHHTQVIDPRLLGWLLEPQLLQGGDKELQDYSLAELAERHLGGMPGGADAAVAAGAGPSGAIAGGRVAAAVPAAGAAAAGALSPFQRMRRALEAARQLGEALMQQLGELELPVETLEREMRVAALLAQMEATGLGFDPWLLVNAGQVARNSMARIEEEAASLAGRPFNLSSPQQLADVLYSELRLPRPTGHGRSAAKTHLPTDETALNQLRQHSPLPSLVLEYRALQNFVSKWVQAEWAKAAAGGFPSAEAYAQAQAAAGAATGGDHSPRAGAAGAAPVAFTGVPRVLCSWNQTATATGRLSSSAPNLQAVTKYNLEAAGSEGLINIRDAFEAPQGCLLLSADYSQVELRVLAHLSGDPALIQLLQQAGPSGDAFKHIASAWLGAGEAASVSKEAREKAKRVTYGLIYGLTPWGLAQGSGALSISVAAAQDLITSFLAYFKGVAAWIEQTKAAARAAGGVVTLAGRRRPIKGLNSADKRVRGEAERKAVNTRIQGTAADLMKEAMLSWCRWHEGQGQPPVRIVAQLHDELLLEVDASQVDPRWAAQELCRVMEGVGSELRVPLAAKVKMGQRWGSLAAVQ